MLGFLASMCATVAVAVAGTFGYHLRTADDVQSPIREYQEQQAPCGSSTPTSSRAAAMCALLEDQEAALP